MFDDIQPDWSCGSSVGVTEATGVITITDGDMLVVDTSICAEDSGEVDIDKTSLTEEAVVVTSVGIVKRETAADATGVTGNIVSIEAETVAVMSVCLVVIERIADATDVTDDTVSIGAENGC